MLPITAVAISSSQLHPGGMSKLGTGIVLHQNSLGKHPLLDLACHNVSGMLQDASLSLMHAMLWRYRLTFEERAGLAQNAAGKKLFELMARKRSNLAVAADVGTVQEMLRIADAAGPHIAVFKTHVDIFDEWSPDIAAKLQKLAEKHGE